MALRPLRSKASNSSWRWAGVNRNRPSLPARMMEESEGVGSDDVDCIRDYVCSLCPRVASARLLSAYAALKDSRPESAALPSENANIEH